MTTPAFDLDADGRVPASQQTRVAMFLVSAFGAYARRLSALVPGPLRDAPAVALHAEYFGVLEAVSLITRSTSWTFDAWAPMQLARWELAWLPQPVLPPGTVADDALIDLAAFGHALLGGLRPATLLPANANPADPFVLALRTLDVESGRLIQSPAAILRHPTFGPRQDAVQQRLDSRYTQVRGLWAEVVAAVTG